MRIVFVNSLYPPFGASGAEGTLRLLAGSLSARGHACSVITLTPERHASTAHVDGIEVRYLPLANVYWPHGSRRPAALRPVFQAIESANPIMRARLESELRRAAPDVVHAHNLQGFSATAWRAAHRAGVPLVQTLHDYYTACPRSAMWRPERGNCANPCTDCRIFAAPRRALSRLPAAVTCVSHRVFTRINATGAFPTAGTPLQPVRIIRGNNATDNLPPQPALSESGRLRLGFMGRLDPAKGLDMLLDAFHRLPKDAVSLAIAGSGAPAYVAELRARAGDTAMFLGHVEPETFFPAIDLLVVPSVWEDPFPRVFHEALSFGVPSLVTPLGGLPEAIMPGQTGFVAAGADVNALHAALHDLLSTGWDRARVQAQCRGEARHYAPSHIASQYESVLSAVAARRVVPGDAGGTWNAPESNPAEPPQRGMVHARD